MTSLTIVGAQEAAKDGGMMSDTLDLSYLGVHSVWTRNLGESSTFG
jgi:hypothetical protein